MSNSDPVDDPGKSGSGIEPVKTTPSSLGGLSATATDDSGGFVTPTADSGQRIPEALPCPPPPRKSTEAGRLRMRRMKRKSLPAGGWSRQTPLLLLDLSSDIDSMFPPILRANLTCKIKKARSV